MGPALHVSRGLRPGGSLLLIVVLATFLCAPTAAQVCVGDCDSGRTVTVDELVLCVAIALGAVSVDHCGACDPGMDRVVTVDELVTGVRNALCGCGQACPTPRPTGTPTVTPTPTATSPPTVTPSASPTQAPALPNVAGTWREDRFQFISSNCAAAITNALIAALAAEPACDATFSQSGASVRGVDCKGVVAEGVVDDSGMLRFHLEAQETVQGCTIAATDELQIEVSRNPTTGTYTQQLSFSGNCPFTDCSAVFESRWTRI